MITAPPVRSRIRRRICWVFTTFAVVACTTGDPISGPATAPGPFAEFDRLAPPAPATGIGVGPGATLGLAPRPATKLTGPPVRASRYIRADDGGRISLYNHPTWARITVFAGSIPRDTVIDVTLRGSGINTSLTFGPDGLAFDPSAVVDVITPVGDMDLANLKAYLTSADGSVEEVPIRKFRIGPLVLIRTWVSHFTDEDFDDGSIGEETYLGP